MTSQRWLASTFKNTFKFRLCVTNEYHARGKNGEIENDLQADDEPVHGEDAGEVVATVAVRPNAVVIKDLSDESDEKCAARHQKQASPKIHDG